ncbi:hypothetical protein EJH27_01650 [Salmonella enterica subsp. enterica serovar Virchow]|nr:hypothetical protein [Salmonella enterica subsp. enterica serovar Virchow]
MKNSRTDLCTSCQSFQKSKERTRLLSEAREILNYFQDNKYNNNVKIIKTIYWIGFFFPLLLALSFYYLKEKQIIELPEYSMLLACSLTSFLIFLLASLYPVFNKKKLGRMDNVIISVCEQSPEWSVPALKASLKMISTIQDSYDKKLSTFKVICAAVTFIIAIAINKSTSSLFIFLTQITSDIFLSVLSLFIISTASLLIITSYVEFIILIFYINHCSVMKTSIEFLISVSEDNVSDESENDNEAFDNHYNRDCH